MKKRYIVPAAIVATLCTAAFTSPSAIAPESPIDPERYKLIEPERQDGASVKTRVYLHEQFRKRAPKLAYSAKPTNQRFKRWQKSVANRMNELMQWEDIDISKARLLSTVQRDGYRVERWEYEPTTGMVIPYLVMIPDGVNESNPAPAILCIPGWGQYKEHVASEPYNIDGEFKPSDRAMGRAYAKEGWIAVIADTPGSGVTADLENLAGRGPDYRTLSRELLEMGSSYLSLYSYINKGLLQWMKTRREMRRDRLVVSGFSFGTEPLMAIGVTDPEVYAFVYNDFLCNTRERALTMTRPDENGRRPWPNDIEHLIPGFLMEFDFPDLVTALAPRPVICTEGGLDRDFKMVERGFAEAGAAGKFEWHHYPKYADPQNRMQIDSVPMGVSLQEYYDMVNVDSPRHGFKRELIIPWLRKHLSN